MSSRLNPALTNLSLPTGLGVSGYCVFHRPNNITFFGSVQLMSRCLFPTLNQLRRATIPAVPRSRGIVLSRDRVTALPYKVGLDG